MKTTFFFLMFECFIRIEYGKYNTPESVMNLEFFKWYNIDLFANFTGKQFFR
jgi:hypothetical protein